MEQLYLYSFLLSLLLTLTIIPFLIRNSSRWGLIDDPAGHARKIHDYAVPRSGGLGIIIASALSALLLLPFESALVSLVGACGIIIFLGFLDDLIQLKPKYKLCVQALCVIVAMAGGMVIYELPVVGDALPWLSYLITFVFVMGVINGVNFLDGMDGLAAGATMMALVLLFIVGIETGNREVAAISLAVSAALLGFLRFNTYPARIFMGDAGSQFLGFILAWLAINVSQGENNTISTVLPLLVVGIPIMDIIQVVPVRLKKGLVWTGPDKEHFHHQIAKIGFFQYEVVAIIYFLQAILLEGAYLLRYESDWKNLVFYSFFVAAILSTIYIGITSDWRVREEQSAASVERRNSFFRKLSGFRSLVDKLILSTLAIVMLMAALTTKDLPALPVSVGIGLGVCALFGTRRFYRGMNLLFGRMVCYAAVILLSFGLAQSIESDVWNIVIDTTVAALSVLLVLGIRITRREYFGLTTEDLLVAIFFIALAPLLLFEFGQGAEIIRLVFRIGVLLYASEYLLNRGDRSREFASRLSSYSLLLLGLNFLVESPWIR